MQLGEEFLANYYNIKNFRAWTCTTTQRDALTLSANDAGLLIFNSTTTQYQYYNGAATNAPANWITLGSNVITLASGNILVGNASNVATAVTMSGDVTISAAGVATIGASKVTNAMLATASSTNTASYVVIRDSNGRFQATDPVAAQDVVTLNYLANIGAMQFKGTIGTSGTYTLAAFNALTTYTAGWQLKVITAGAITIGGMTSTNVEIGDMLICNTTRAGSGNTGSDWNITQANIDGAVTNTTNTSTAGNLAKFSGTTGKIIEDSGIAVANILTTSNKATVTAGSTKITLGGTPTNAALNAFSIDVNEANLNMNNTGTTLGVAKGGTGQASNLNQGGIIYGTSTTAMASTAAGTSGDVVISNGTSAPAFKTIKKTVTLSGTIGGTATFTTVFTGWTVPGTTGLPATDFNYQIVNLDTNDIVLATLLIDSTSTANNPVFKFKGLTSQTTTNGWKVNLQLINY